MFLNLISYAYDVQLDQGQLDALSAAVAEGTFDAAARHLNVTPSAVSQRIKALETSVGQVLLNRSKPIRPTSPGQVLLRIARQMEALTAEAVRELRGAPGDAGAVIPWPSTPTAWPPGSCQRWSPPDRLSPSTCTERPGPDG